MKEAACHILHVLLSGRNLLLLSVSWTADGVLPQPCKHSFTISNPLNRKPLELGPAHLGQMKRVGPRPEGWNKTSAIIASSLPHIGYDRKNYP